MKICYSKSGGAKYAQAEENAVQYITKLLHEYGWGVNHVKKHQDWSGKYCPHRILAENRWESFKQRVQIALEQLKNPIGKYEIVEDKNAKARRIQSGKYTSKEAAIQAFEKSGVPYATIRGTME